MPETFANLIEFTSAIGIDLQGTHLTLDSGFDSKDNKSLVREYKVIPQTYPNRRNLKEPMAIARKFRWFNREIYQERYKVERTFGWQDTYRKLALSYDRLKETRQGFRYLAYSMINFRVTFSKS